MTGAGPGPGVLAIDVDSAADRHVLTLTGQLDVSSVGELRHRVDDVVLEESGDLIVDLRGLDFMDSAGLGALVMAHKKMRVLRRSVAVVTQDGPVHQVVTLTGLHHVLRVFGSVEEAQVGEE